MSEHLRPIFLGLIITFFAGFSLFFLASKDQSTDNPDPAPPNEETPAPDSPLLGVDSVNIADEDFMQCITGSFGDPAVFGRYMVDKEGVSHGLTSEEIEYLHANDIAILPIYNHFEDATTYEAGVAEAEQAVAFANDYQIPEGVALFADIEPIYPVDHQFILGWHDTIAASPYQSGIYGVFSADSELSAAFQQAVAENEDVLAETVIWSNQPQVGITTKATAPEEFAMEGPEGGLLYAWQYGLDAEVCNIDTNLFQPEILDYLWR